MRGGTHSNLEHQKRNVYYFFLELWVDVYAGQVPQELRNLTGIQYLGLESNKLCHMFSVEPHNKRNARTNVTHILDVPNLTRISNGFCPGMLNPETLTT